MIRIAICDDEAATRAYLASLIRAQSVPCEITEYASAGSCLADRHEIDLLFLDIELDASGNASDGMKLARTIRERNAAVQPVIVFVTGYDRYVFDAFDVGAFQYLLKPVNEEKFARVFTSAVKHIQASRERTQRGQVLTLQSAGARYFVWSDHRQAVA